MWFTVLLDWLIPVLSFLVWFDISALTVGYFRGLHFVSVSYTDLSSSVLRIRAIEFCFWGLQVRSSAFSLDSGVFPMRRWMIGCCPYHKDSIGAADVYCCCLSPPVNWQYHLSSLWLDAWV